MERRSDTNLATRLGFKPGMRVWFHDMPPAVRAAIAPERLPLDEMDCASEGLQAVHLFAAHPEHLARELAALHTLLPANGFCWVSWSEPPSTGGLDAAQVAAIAADQGWRGGDACTMDGWTSLKLTPGGGDLPRR